MRRMPSAVNPNLLVSMYSMHFASLMQPFKRFCVPVLAKIVGTQEKVLVLGCVCVSEEGLNNLIIDGKESI